MACIEVPQRFVTLVQAATASDLYDLRHGTTAWRNLGWTAAQIVERLVQAGWDPQFSVWYVDCLFETGESLELVSLVKGGGNRSAGLLLSLLGSAWIVVWPWLGIPPLLAVFGGVALIWEGFARLAKSMGLSRVHGVCSITVVIVYYAIFFWWIGAADPAKGEDESLRLPYLVMNALLPVTVTWAMFYLSIRQGKKRVTAL